MSSGAFINGPDYVHWHGIYEQLIDLTELKERDTELRSKGVGSRLILIFFSINYLIVFVDVLIAHSLNRFYPSYEWIPIIFPRLQHSPPC